MTTETETEPKKETKGVKEILEFMDGLAVVVPMGVEVAADKQLSSKDIKPVVEAVKKYDIVVDGIKGYEDIIPEAKDIDQMELMQIGAKAVELFKLSKEAYLRGK